MCKYKVGDIVKGMVTGIEKYGIFVSFDDGYTGLIHISEISDAFVRNVFDYAELNEKIKVKVVDVNVDLKKMKLSIKNIDYREKSKFNRKILETEHAFSTLKSVLPGWISAKEEEILKKSKKK